MQQGNSQGNKIREIPLVSHGKSDACILVDAHAGVWEERAAKDLAHYIQMMSGADIPIVKSASSVKPNTPCLVVGTAAFGADERIAAMLQHVSKKNTLVRWDAIAVKRVGNRLLLAGSNDESHYFAVSWLLQKWGCRWYLPTEFGECIPELKTLTMPDVDFAYASPFEIRHYWLSWYGDNTGANEFRRRNYMTEATIAGNGHALGQYCKNLIPEGGSVFDVSLTDPKTAEEIAKQIEPQYAAGVPGISLAIEDGNYGSKSDKSMQFEYDHQALMPSFTDAMLTLYNRVAAILRRKYPESKTTIGGLAYANVTMPPVSVKQLEPNIVIWLAPIFIDPNHGMDSPLSKERQDYRRWMETWAKLTHGQLLIYDYDQGMMVWRDIPNPSQQAFVQDVKHYAKSGILGIGTESRGAMATVFLNLYLRGQLMWNPDVNVAGLLKEFYSKFFGPCASSMERYWTAIYKAWQDTIVTEHEYMLIPAIYTPQLMRTLEQCMRQAEAEIEPLVNKKNPSRNEAHYIDRMRFMKLSYTVLSGYTNMVRCAASDVQYAEAVRWGETTLQARQQLTDMNGTFTTYKVMAENGAAWFPGEVQQMRDLAEYANGKRGRMISTLPLEWWWRKAEPLPKNWTYEGPVKGIPSDSQYAQQTAAGASGWIKVRTDLYLQAQKAAVANGQGYMGSYWYQCKITLTPEQVSGAMHLMFPGLFNETWLYINGEYVANREYKEPWWQGGYEFEWDVEIRGLLKAGENTIAVKGFNPHHFGGMFRRTFIYRANS